MPNVPTLSTTAIISTAVAGVASTAASGSQAWNGHSGALTAKANMKPRNSALSTAGSDAELTRGRRGHDRPEVEGAAGDACSCAVDHVQPDHRGEHDQPAEQVVQQELHRRARAVRARRIRRSGSTSGSASPRRTRRTAARPARQARSAPSPRRPASAPRRCVRTRLRSPASFHARHDQQRHQHRGQHDQRQRDAVHARGCSRCRKTGSSVVFDELVLRAAGSNVTASDDGDREHRQRQRQPEPTSPVRAAPAAAA